MIVQTIFPYLKWSDNCCTRSPTRGTTVNASKAYQYQTPRRCSSRNIPARWRRLTNGRSRSRECIRTEVRCAEWGDQGKGRNPYLVVRGQIEVAGFALVALPPLDVGLTQTGASMGITMRMIGVRASDFAATVPKQFHCANSSDHHGSQRRTEERY